MPKFVDENTDEVKPKRAPRKRVTPVTSPRKRAVKKQPTTEAILDTTEPEKTIVNKRKAPTRLKEVNEFSNHPEKSFRNLYIIGAIVIVGFGAAALIGYSDDGQIDISSVVSERNARVASGNINPETDGASPSSIVVPVQNSETQVIDGGLERSSEPPPVLEIANKTEESSSTATTTDAQVGEDILGEENQTSSSTEVLDNENPTAESFEETTPPGSDTPSN